MGNDKKHWVFITELLHTHQFVHMYLILKNQAWSMQLCLLIIIMRVALFL